MHDDGTDLGIHEAGEKELVADLAKCFYIGKGQVSVIGGVDLGCLGENGAIIFVEVGGEDTVKPKEHCGVKLSSVRIVDVVELVVGADQLVVGELGSKICAAKKMTLVTLGGYTLDEEHVLVFLCK